MESISKKSGEGIFAVEAKAIICGVDIAVVFAGGDRKHIGAVALGVPRPSLADEETNSASSSVICAVGHKEDLLARQASLILAANLNCRVAVTVGLHVDNANLEIINILTKNFDETLQAINNELMQKKDSY